MACYCKIFARIMLDSTLQRRGKAKLMADFVNNHVDLSLCFVMLATGDRAIPVTFTQQHLKEYHIDISETDKIITTRFMFTKGSVCADVMLAQMTRDNRVTSIEDTKCHIFFSEQCTKDMAVTAYFIMLQVSNTFRMSHFSEETFGKYGDLVIRKFGSTLTSFNITDFMNEKLLLIKDRWIKILMRRRDVYRNNIRDNKSTATLVQQLNSKIKEVCKWSPTYIDCCFDVPSGTLKIIFLKNNFEIGFAVCHQKNIRLLSCYLVAINNSCEGVETDRYVVPMTRFGNRE